MENLLSDILKENDIQSNKIVDATVAKLIQNARIFELSKSIKNLKSEILQIFNMYKEKEEFKETQISVPNANVKKEYNFCFDLTDFPTIKIKDIKNLDVVGLHFDAESCCISGTPTNANQTEIQVEFYSTLDENSTIDVKPIIFIVNADPKDLWLNKPSPKDSRFPKEENITFASAFLDKKIVVASKRGRSHAHEGTFRDDDFTVKTLPDNWSIIAVADGAGSSRMARAGSKFATENIASSFDDENILKELSSNVQKYFTQDNFQNEADLDHSENDTDSESNSPENNNETKIKIKGVIINTLYSKVKNLQASLAEFAKSEELTLKEIHTTLIFALIKKFEFGYVILSFGVGDCPINVLEDNDTKVKLLNFLDVGEFGGGTRFMTMPEILSRPDMVDRFGINCFKDFSKLFLMTDGIYDPKFVVESKLENIETWKNFLRDLSGENEDQIKVDFENDAQIEAQLSDWMDFWSKGNHDDRTLAIIY